MSEKGAFIPADQCFQFRKPKVVIIAAQWHDDIVGRLIEDAKVVLAERARIVPRIERVPGCYELPQAASLILRANQSHSSLTAPNLGIITFGCVVRGETPHFDFISQAAALGIEQLACRYATPIMFGVLTTHTVEQALARADGTYSRKGQEVAFALLQMMGLAENLLPQY